jgi:hypothetical protein
MSDELLSPGEGDKSGDETIRSLFRNRRVLRMASALCAGLAQGVVVYLMSRSSQQWYWYITASLLPLPFYLAGEVSGRVAIALIPWGALLILLDSAQIFFRNPYAYWQSGFALSAMAYTGALLLLPNFVSWIDGEGALPEWRISFRHFSRVFFASIIAGLFLLLFFAVLSIGYGLAKMIGISISRWSDEIFVIISWAAWGAVFHWTAGARRLLEVLERYVLALFSCLLPFLSVFTLIFIAALPMGIDRLWRRGFSSSIILGIFLASGLCAFSGWQGGVMADGKPREPFFRPVNNLVKAALVPLPIFCPLLVYTIGLRIEQYSWTVDRVVSMTLAILFGLWSLAWAFFLIRRWNVWPIYYGKVNRIAFPLIGVALILLSSPICDARRIILRERFAWLRESIQAGGDVGGFDWGYIARHLGLYGVRAMEELEAGGGAGIHAKFGPFGDDSQAAKIQDKITAELASIKKEKKVRESPGKGVDESNREAAYEGFVLSARSAPVFGGELGPDERERLARGLPKNLAASMESKHTKIGFFCLTDMDGDGERDVLLGLGGDIYLLLGGSAFQLRERAIAHESGGADADNKMALSADKQRIISYRWNMLQINGRIFFVDPSDAVKIEAF